MEYQNQGLDRLLAVYCSPALAGIKPANLVACDRARYPDLPHRLRAYRKAFADRGMRFEILCSCGGRYLLLVYQQQQLAQRLAEPSVQRALRHFGYAEGQTMDALLCRLRCRMAASDGFPHEIGLFLGYPVEDVMGFVRYGGRGCRLSGYWKVYGDAEEAARLFERLSRVCRAVTRRVEQGETLLQVFAAS